MEPISAALLGALTAGLVSGTQDTAKRAVGDLYDGVKTLIRRKVGEQALSLQTLAVLEQAPDTPGLGDGLPALLAQDGVTDDPEITAAADELLAAVRKEAPEAVSNVQIAKGDGIAQAGPNAHASVTVNGQRRGD